MFKAIKDHIKQPQSSYKVVSIGMHPSIAQYNGFYTLDSYQNLYPLSHKKKFRKIIVRELDKNNALKTYFDDWGSRCYVFSDTLKKTCYLDCHKDINLEAVDIDLDIDVLKANNVQYIFSTVQLENNSKTILLDKVFEHEESR